MKDKVISVMKILDGKNQVIACHPLAADWHMAYDGGKAILHIPVTVMTFGEIINIANLVYENTPTTIQIAKYNFTGFAICEVLLSSLLDEGLPDHIIEVTAVSSKKPGKEDFQIWFRE